MKFVGTLLRIVTAALWLLTSLYALLAYVPFTFRQVISITLIPSVQVFAQAQPILIVASTLLLAAFVLKIEKRSTVSIEDRRELFILIAAAVAIAAWNLPKRIQSSDSALVLSFACLLPPIWMAFFNLRDVYERRAFALSSSSVMLTAVLAGCVVALTSAFTYQNSFAQGFVAQNLLLVVASALGIGGVAALLERFISSARLTLQSALSLYAAGLAVLLGVFLADQFCASIAFFGPLAWAWSFAFSAGLSFTITTIGARAAIRKENLDLYSLRWISRGVIFRFAEIPTLFILTLAYCYAQRTVLPIDWNGLIQKAIALALFVVSFFILILIVPDIGSSVKTRPYRKLRVLSIVAMTFAAIAAIFELRQSQLRLRADRPTDPVVLLARSLLFPENSEAGFFAELQSRTNLPRTVDVKLPQLQIKKTNDIARRPLIFIFVIDSLRRDYVSAYNPAVSFTPNLKRFADDATVFQQAFTRYGATGLSEPSIWAGRMFPHQMYPQPFETINLLHQVIKREKYDIWISRDSILSEILKPSEAESAPAKERDLDVGVGTQELDFCRTSEEIVARLRDDPTARPFVYSQSQNIHVSVLARGPNKAPSELDLIPGFHAPYARSLRRVDTCFGKFIDELKSMQLYDQSLIVLTSDHGDSLGEEGRFGHAYTIYPEIVRLPLLVRLPAEMKDRVPRTGITFSTDIASTVASALGYETEAVDWWVGRPLFFDKSNPPSAEPEGPHLVMSSYGPVAGLISAQGKPDSMEFSIAITDAINFSNYVYGFKGLDSSNVSADQIQKNNSDRVLKDKIDELYSAFGL